jgi:hypothetical protein
MTQKLTPLAQLKATVESLPKLEGARDYTRGHNDCRKLVIDEIDKLLAEERSIVIDAYIQGSNDNFEILKPSLEKLKELLK